MRKLVAMCIGLGLVAACGGEQSDDIQKAKSALTPRSYSIGNASSLVFNAPWSINYLTQNLAGQNTGSGFPPPSLNPSSAYQWGTVTNIDNGGTGTSCGGNPLTCAGYYNSLTFEVTALGSAYYVAKVSAWVSWNFGLNTTYHPSFLQAVVHGGTNGNSTTNGDSVQFYWHAPTVEIYVLNYLGTVVQHKTSTVNYSYGGAPNKIYGTSVTFTMDNDGSYNGCMRDVPGYNYPSFGPETDKGFLTIATRYGSSQPSFTSYVGQPTSNPQCNMHSIDNTSLGTSTVWWDNPGF